MLNLQRGTGKPVDVENVASVCWSECGFCFGLCWYRSRSKRANRSSKEFLTRRVCIENTRWCFPGHSELESGTHVSHDQLLSSPAFHHAVRRVHKTVHEIRHGKGVEDMGGTKLDRQSPQLESAFCSFLDFPLNQVNRLDQLDLSADD